MENPWQGAPPNTTSICLRPIPARFLISSPVSPMTDRDNIAHWENCMRVQRNGLGRFQLRRQYRNQPVRSPIQGPQRQRTSRLRSVLAPSTSCFQIPAYRVLPDLSIGILPGGSQKGNEPPFQFVAVPRLTLPNGHRTPTRAAQCPQVPFVLQTVLLQLWQPELWAGFWRAANAASVGVPKTAVNENDLPPRRENDVGSAW